MKMKHLLHTKNVSLVVILSLCLLPSCAVWDWVKEKLGMGKPVAEKVEPQSGSSGTHNTTDVLVTMGGKPIITVESFQQEKQELFESNPRLKAMLAFMDEKQLDRNLIDGLTHQAIVDKYVIDSKIDQSKEYQQELERMSKSIRHMLNAKFFGQGIKVAVSDSEVKDFYEENKDTIPELMLSKGGIKTDALMFGQEAAAKEFMQKVQAHRGDMQKAAKEAGMADKVKAFNLVNEQSIGIDPALRDKIVALKSVPTVELFKIDDKAFWVVSASKKEESRYIPFNAEVQAGLKQTLEKEKHSDLIKNEIERLKDEYKVVIDEDFFKAEEENAQQDEQNDALAGPMNTASNDAKKNQESGAHGQVAKQTPKAIAQA